MASNRSSRIRKIVTLSLVLLGILSLLLAFLADSLGVDSTPGFGIIQVFAFLTGLSSLTLAAFLVLQSLRPEDAPRSLQADIGLRLAATGLVFCYVAGLSDLIGIGTHVDPSFNRPYVGPLQAGGILLGVVMIVAGMILYYTSRGGRTSSSLEFLVGDGEVPLEGQAMLSNDAPDGDGDDDARATEPAA